MKSIKSLSLVIVAAFIAFFAMSCTKEDKAMKKLSGSWYMSELNLEISSSIIPNATSSHTMHYTKEDTKAVISLGADGTLTGQLNEDGTEMESVIANWSADGNVISKRRYVIPLENPQFTDDFISFSTPELVIELDIFAPPFAPLIMAEVEFPSEEMANAFLPPDWFDEDVTMNPEYHNSNMSRKIM